MATLLFLFFVCSFFVGFFINLLRTLRCPVVHIVKQSEVKLSSARSILRSISAKMIHFSFFWKISTVKFITTVLSSSAA